MNKPKELPQTEQHANATGKAVMTMPGSWGALGEYARDVLERTALYWDLQRQRSTQHFAREAEAVPSVLSFETELLLDARTFTRPANYLLYRIEPPAGITLDPAKRPFVVVDPRAGHGPGIGGFKPDSELGVAMQAGHPCYFVGFTRDPMPGQTIEDVMHAEAVFIEKVADLHRDAEGKPCVIGNCQAGWAVMMLAATRPELCGPIIVSGSPLSYWAGIEGRNAMRYSGGLLGGSWLAALSSDLGKGRFDGGHLVRNFENLNPANTWWSKQYDVWSTIDTGAERYLDFEKWWGGHVNLNGEEIQWIVDNLFVGNRLATAELVTGRGERIDLRNIRSPILCFCSEGDNITPPPQALGWIVDLYAKDDDVRACGQTIVYAIHDSVGHLGVFVSTSVAKKEYREFASNIDLIDVLPPGLYEAVMTPKTPDAAHPELVRGDWIVRFEPRRLDDLRAIVQPSLENERRFAAVRRVSEINLGLYRSFLQPFVKAAANLPAEWSRHLGLADLSRELFSDRNPVMVPVKHLAEEVRGKRHPASPENPFVQWQTAVSDAIVTALDGWRDLRDATMEKIFLATYGSPLLQALVGLRASDDSPRRRPGKEPERIAFVAARIRELREGIGQGGEREAVIRCLLHVGMAGRGIDERAFNQLVQMRAEHEDLSLEAFKRLVRDQYFSLLIDQDAALAAIPSMLPSDRKTRMKIFDDIRRTVHATGDTNAEQEKRLYDISVLFAIAVQGTNGTRRNTRPQTPVAASVG
jgi:pimeloyl-ACP methyl ester carboxylesterase